MAEAEDPGRPTKAGGTARAGLFSASRQIAAMASTARTGYFPMAVSAESITASLPSMTALATSVTSARVGRGEEVIDSSISVAVIEMPPTALVAAMISFWTRGSGS